MIRTIIAAALMLAPAPVLGQTTAQAEPVTVEILASGRVELPADHFRITVGINAEGADEAAARAALDAKRAEVTQALASLGITPASPGPDTNNALSISSLIAGFAGQTGQTISVVPQIDAEAGEQTGTTTTAAESLAFDAPSRAAVASAKLRIEAADATLGNEVIALLRDYVAPTRRAKADALRNGQAEADAYAAALGLRRATLVRVSERQDIVSGSLTFISQLVGMFMPGRGQLRDTVPVQVSLAAEYRLSR